MASELYLIRKDGRFAKFSKVEAVELTSDRTGDVDSDSMLVWSGDFRDLGFTPTTSTNSAIDAGLINVANGYVKEAAALVGDGSEMATAEANGIARVPDNIAHEPLRQSLMYRTHWKFDRGASAAPRYLFATWERGDIIADNPPSR